MNHELLDLIKTLCMFLSCNFMLLCEGEYGVPKRWYFLFTRSYWCSKYSSDDAAGAFHQYVELELNSEGSFYFLHAMNCLKILIW